MELIISGPNITAKLNDKEIIKNNFIKTLNRFNLGITRNYHSILSEYFHKNLIGLTVGEIDSKSVISYILKEMGDEKE